MQKSVSWVFVLGVSALAMKASGSVVALSDNFDSYTAGNLLGQGGWLQTGTSTVAPIQVGTDPVSTSNAAVLGTTGQDLYEPFSVVVPRTPGNTMDTTMTIDVTAAGTGDYFTHLSDPAGTTTVFLQRLFVKSTTGGYLLGLEPTAGGGGVVTYGTTVEPLGTDENIDVTWSFAAGLTSDTFTVSVGGTPYAGLTSVPWGSTVTEPSQLSSFNLRQGTTGQAPSVTVDNVVVSASAVPEPASLGLLGIGAIGLLARRRRAV